MSSKEEKRKLIQSVQKFKLKPAEFSQFAKKLENEALVLAGLCYLDDESALREFVKEIIAPPTTGSKYPRYIENANKALQYMESNSRKLNEIYFRNCTERILKRRKYTLDSILHISDESAIARLKDCNGSAVAVKFVVDKEMGIHEAKILKKVGRNAHIVKMIDFFPIHGECKYKFALVLKLYEPDQSFKPSSKEEVCDFIYQTLQALEYCHSKGVTHGDVKRSNILLKNKDSLEVVLADFGVASLDESLCGGTLMYEAPEVRFGGRRNTKSDMWSVGLMFAEMLDIELSPLPITKRT